jgi:hypothetical protein
VAVCVRLWLKKKLIFIAANEIFPKPKPKPGTKHKNWLSRLENTTIYTTLVLYPPINFTTKNTTKDGLTVSKQAV